MKWIVGKEIVLAHALDDGYYVFEVDFSSQALSFLPYLVVGEKLFKRKVS